MTVTTKSGTRNVKSYRPWDGSYEDLERAAIPTGFAPSTLVGHVMEVMLGYVRCKRCSEPIPVVNGNIAGMDLLQVTASVVKEALSQRCWAYEGVNKGKRPAHKPVLLGAEPGTPADGELAARDRAENTPVVLPRRKSARAKTTARHGKAALVAAEDARPAAVDQLREDIPGLAVASELPPRPAGTAVFLTSEPDAAPVIGMPVPDTPAAKTKRSRARTSECHHRVASGSWCKTCQAVKA